MLSQKEMDALKQIAKGIAGHFGSSCEVVIHELTEKSADNSIVAIENGHVSGRKVGDGPSHVVLEQLGQADSNPEDHIGYLTRTPDGKILKSDTLVAKNYLNEKELSRLNRLVTMFIDYAELMAEDEQLMSMQDWLSETDRFLTNNRRKVLEGKGHISHEAAVKKVGTIYEEFRQKQDADYISEFDRQIAVYLKGDKL